MLPSSFEDASQRLIEIGRRFDARGWVLGTSGNFSVVLDREPLRLVITSSGASKGDLTADQILEIDANLDVLIRPGLERPLRQPSAEARLHLEIVSALGAAAVLHTHSMWSTLLSDRYHLMQGLAIEGYEMLKGLAGVNTHKHREWVPILENDQDMSRLGSAIRRMLADHPTAHAFLLRRHGMYTWGKSLTEAVRHVEIVEFLLEAVARAEEARSWRSSRSRSTTKSSMSPEQ
jgi:methylthioribulose-1-phosphate dehydratase